MSTPVLIVDDDAVFGRLLARTLSAQGYAVETAADASEALAAMREHQPDFVLLDMKLGEDAGLDLIEPLLAIRSDAHVIVLTAYASIPTTVEAMRRGATDYLCKPVDSDTVLRALRGETVAADAGEDGPMSLRRLEWEHIQRLLQDNDGNVSETARQLGMHRRSLQRKLAKRPVRN